MILTVESSYDACYVEAMSARHRRTIGILAGMGPRAGVACLDAVFAAARADGARLNHEFPRVALISVPASSQVATRDGRDELVAQLGEEARRLARSGADVFLLACVTMHEEIERLAAATGQVWVSLVDTTVDWVLAQRHRKVAVLATESTEREGLFRRPLEANGVEVVALEPQERCELSELIERLIGGDVGASDVAWLHRLTVCLGERGATALVLGCTDLSALPSFDVAGVTVIDALAIGAEAAWRSSCQAPAVGG